MKRSAGILLYRVAGGGHEVLLVHPGGPFWAKKDLGAWSIPKGEIDEGEEPRACALRELEEELGTPPPLAPRAADRAGLGAPEGEDRPRPGPPRPTSTPATLNSNTFTMEWPPRSGNEQEFPEVDRAEWFAPDEARRKIIPAQAELIDRLLERLEPLPDRPGRTYTRHVATPAADPERLNERGLRGVRGPRRRRQRRW